MALKMAFYKIGMEVDVYVRGDAVYVFHNAIVILQTSISEIQEKGEDGIVAWWEEHMKPSTPQSKDGMI
jgi:hypothetical protein